MKLPLSSEWKNDRVGAGSEAYFGPFRLRVTYSSSSIGEENGYQYSISMTIINNGIHKSQGEARRECEDRLRRLIVLAGEKLQGDPDATKA